ncbi:MAG TPA: ABC transporter permease [Dongiaceae bacterium]|nr:ABC transporter permease [Dongiaceae bacterium]
MHRYSFVLTRPLQLVPVLFGISVLSFFLVKSIPGDPVRLLLGTKATPEAVARIRAQYGLDDSLLAQYLAFLKNLGAGEMGHSILYKMPVLPLIADRVMPTLLLVFGSVLLTLLIAIPLASVAALRRGGATDHAIRVVTTAGLGFPPFWLGIMLIILFSVTLGMFPVAGYGEDALDKLHHMILPCLTVALAMSAVMTRNLRASMIQELASDHATAARAKGLPESWVFRRHVLPNSLIPTINLLAINVGWLIGGSVVVETVFSLPGMGQLLVRAIFTRDYMVVQGVTLVFACATVVLNFLADVLTVAVDPRVKL